MTRAFNDNELRIARAEAFHHNITLSAALKKLNAEYGVQQWEHMVGLTRKQHAHLDTISVQRSKPAYAIAAELRAQYGATWGSKLQNIVRRTT